MLTDIDQHSQLDTESKYLDNLKVLGCNVSSAARALLRVRGHWSRCLTDLEHSNALTIAKEVGIATTHYFHALRGGSRHLNQVTIELSNHRVTNQIQFTVTVAVF